MIRLMKLWTSSSKKAQRKQSIIINTQSSAQKQKIPLQQKNTSKNLSPSRVMMLQQEKTSLFSIFQHTKWIMQKKNLKKLMNSHLKTLGSALNTEISFSSKETIKKLLSYITKLFKLTLFKQNILLPKQC